MDASVKSHPRGELEPFLDRFRRRLRLCDGWSLVQRSLWIALLATLFVQLAGRFWPVENLEFWTSLPGLAWLIWTAGYSLLRPFPALQVARRLDLELGLKERLSTALCLEKPELPGKASLGSRAQQRNTLRSLPSFPADLVDHQRQDALAAVREIEPRRALPLSFSRRPLLLAGLMAAGIIALAVLPNPMDAVLAQRAAVAETAKQQAEQIEKLEQQVEEDQGLTPEERDELLRKLAELSEQLRANPGDLEQALADLSRTEQALRQGLDPNLRARQSALESLASQLQSLAKNEAKPGESELAAAAEALQELANQMSSMQPDERQALAQALAQLAGRAAQAGDAQLAQSLAALSQAAQSGDAASAAQAAQSAGKALQSTEREMSDQAALEQALAQLSDSRQALAQSGQAGNQARAQGQGQGQNRGQGQSQGQGQGQGQGQPGGGGGTTANTLPPANRTGRAGSPQGPGQSSPEGTLDGQVYVPRERLQGNGDQLFIPGQDTGQGDTSVTESQDPMPGATGPALVPYTQVFQSYAEAANHALEQSYIPPGLKDYVREYFSQLEP